MAVKELVSPKTDVDSVPIDNYAFAMRNRTPEQVEAARARLLALSQEPRPLPPGKTLEDVIVGQLLDDDSEEDVLATLDEIS